MRAIGYARAGLFSCKYANVYSVIICAPDIKTAKEAFLLYLKNNEQRTNPGSGKIKIRRLKLGEDRPLLWAQVDVLAIR